MQDAESLSGVQALVSSGLALVPLPKEWADAANAARGLCESEANRWNSASPATAAYWRSVAMRLGALYLTQDVIGVQPELKP